MMDRFADYQRRIETVLEHTLGAETPVPRLMEAMRYATLGGGKRLRPLLVYAAGEACGAQPPTLDPVAAAVELIHVYSLIHDDLPAMDDDDLRRGKPTCHKAYGEALAILAGDALQALAFSLLADADFVNDKDTGINADDDASINTRIGNGNDVGNNTEISTRIGLSRATNAEIRVTLIRELGRASGLHGMAGGQALDLLAQGRKLNLSELETMHRLKTGALIRGSVLMGAQAALAPLDLQARLATYAQAIGLAFQIRDDLLDVEGDPEETGKACGADNAHEKATFPRLLGIEASWHRAHELVNISLEALQPLGSEAELLRSLARYIVDRRH